MTPTGTAEGAVPPAEAIEDFGDLYPRRVGLNTVTVLSLSDEGFTAYQCNLNSLECDCRDKAFNREEGEVCKHLAVALYQQPQLDGLEEDVLRDVANDIGELRDHVEATVQKATNAEAEAAAAQEATEEPQANGTEEAGVDDPVEAFKSLLRDAGLDPDDFEVYIDDQYGSLQATQDGYLEDGEFDTWTSLTSDLDMNYDPDGDVNYLKPDRFPEVLG